MDKQALLRSIDAVTIPVPDLAAGLRFYRDGLGHQVLWRNAAAGQIGLRMPETDTEIVLTVRQDYQPDWLVTSLDEALVTIGTAGGRRVAGPVNIPVGRLAVAADPFGNELVLIELSKGRYVTDAAGDVTGVELEG